MVYGNFFELRLWKRDITKLMDIWEGYRSCICINYYYSLLIKVITPNYWIKKVRLKSTSDLKTQFLLNKCDQVISDLFICFKLKHFQYVVRSEYVTI